MQVADTDFSLSFKAEVSKAKRLERQQQKLAARNQAHFQGQEKGFPLKVKVVLNGPLKPCGSPLF